MKNLLNKFYFKKLNNNPPIFLQIIGWTNNAEKKNVLRKYVYVRKVPLNIKNTIFGGNFNFDYKIINSYLYEINLPIKKPIKNQIMDKAILKDNGNSLLFQGKLIPIWKPLI